MFAWLSHLVAKRGPSWIEVAELRRLLGQSTPPLVVDVRQPEEFAGPLGHIPDARNIPLADVPSRRGELGAVRRPIVFVCLTDKRSSQAAADLIANGVSGVSVLRGGMKAWRELDAGPGSA